MPSHLRQSHNQSQSYDPYNIALAPNDGEAESDRPQEIYQAQSRPQNLRPHQLELGTNDGGAKSGISGLNLGAGLFSDGEPTTAALVARDKELNQLKLWSPSQNNFQTVSDADEREERNK